MKEKRGKKVFYYSLIFFITSCVTINIYFPAAAVEKAADRIVEEVWGDTEKKPENEKPGTGVEPQSMLRDSIESALSLIGPSEAYAQDADINVTTPAIRALKDSIQQRSESIKPFMDSGNAGISKDGLIVIRSADGLNLKEKASLNRLVQAENDDRASLYSEIAKANNFTPDRVADVQKIFAGSWMKNARAGWWLEGEGGSWGQK